MSNKTQKIKQIKKENYWNRIQEVVYKYKNVLFVDTDNVSSLQAAKLRAKLREVGAYTLMGKNTLMRKALQDANAKEASPLIDMIIKELRGNINLIFTNGDPCVVKAVLDQEVRGAAAKAGMIAPCDVIVPAGPTGMDPNKTTVFQQLNIATKIQKGCVAVIADTKIINAGEKIGSGQAAVLAKLKICPFEFKMNAVKVIQDGILFDAKHLDIAMDAVLGKFQQAAQAQAALALGAGAPTILSAPHSLVNGFQNLVAAASEVGYEFPEAVALLDALSKKAKAANVEEAKSSDADATGASPHEEPADVGVDMFALFDEAEVAPADDEDIIDIWGDDEY